MRILIAAAAFICVALSACGRSEPAPDEAPAQEPASAPLSAQVKGGGPTLKAVRARGRLNCGVHPGLPGFALRDSQGVWRGFDVDLCRAVAAAVLGRADAVRFVPVSTKTRFDALTQGRVDMLSRNSTWTFSRDVGGGMDFVGVSYYDGQGFLAPRSLNLQSASELNGARVCVQAATTSQEALGEYFAARDLTYIPVVVADETKARAAYEGEDCDVVSADISTLAAMRAQMNNPAAQVILPDVISKEPLGPAVREGDARWSDIVRWSLYTLILAEELGLTQDAAAAALKTPPDPETQRLLDGKGRGAMLGLDDAWAYRIVRQVGSYAEVFDRNLGPQSPLRLERGLNALWSADEPGLLYAPPLR